MMVMVSGRHEYPAGDGNPCGRWMAFVLNNAKSWLRIFYLGLGITCSLVFLAACNSSPLPGQPGGSPSAASVPSPTPVVMNPLTQAPPRQTPTPSLTSTPPAWQGYPAPTTPTVTAIPPPFSGVQLPPAIKVTLLLGTDTDSPHVGRTDTIILLLYNPELAKASLLSIPRDLFVYIPGYSMERINMAYPLGGIDLLMLTLEYNFNLVPEDWLLVHLNDFGHFIDDLGGIDISVTTPVKDQWCDIPAGNLHLNGYQALCYVRTRTGSSDIDRNRRQQEMIHALIKTLLSGGNLVHLPEWYDKYQSSVVTSLTLPDLISYIPLALEFGDDSRVMSSQIGWEQVIPWSTASSGGESVLLPQRQAIESLLQRIITFLLTPASPSDLVLTLEAELTASPTPTATPTPLITASNTATPLPPEMTSTIPPAADTPTPTP
jgi:polyisoprenyl-teichoic acid--peptidoglycan teichoic acid transferase